MRQYGYVHSEFGDPGRVIRVTNNNPDGPGSLYAALRMTEPRVVVFEVGGLFRLPGSGLCYFGLGHADVSVYGQTAPTPVIIDGNIRICSHDVLFEHVTIVGRRSASEAQCADVMGNRDNIRTENVVFSHCSMFRGYSKAFQSWSYEPGQKANQGGVHGLTLQDCLFAEPLLGPKGDSRRLVILQEATYRAAILRCLFVGGDCRNPALQEDLSALIANNLVYDAGTESIHTIRTNGQGPTDAVIVNNVIRPGPNTQTGVQCGDRILINRCHSGSRIYMSGNVAPRAAVVHSPEAIVTASPPLTIPVPLLTADLVPEYVLQNAGATLPIRELRSQETVERVRAGMGYRADTNEQWDAIPYRRPVDTSGSVDEWLARYDRPAPVPAPPVDTEALRASLERASVVLAETADATREHAAAQALRLAAASGELARGLEALG